MKLVFYTTGDHLEFAPKNTKFVNEWFDFLFDKQLNSKYQGEQNSWHVNSTEERLTAINKHIDDVNDFLKISLPTNTIMFENNDTLNQPWLNSTHKKWVVLTDLYKNEIYDIPWELKNSWSEINNLIHFLELGYTNTFYNTLLSHIPKGINLKVAKEDGDYTQRDLVLNYDNLGRHQYNQWEMGSDIDDETSNYNTVSTSFHYMYHQEHAPLKKFSPAPEDYVSWCEERNVEILPPWVVLGRFDLPVFTVREIMHRNLKIAGDVGFEQ